MIRREKPSRVDYTEHVAKRVVLAGGIAVKIEKLRKTRHSLKLAALISRFPSLLRRRDTRYKNPQLVA